jgi:AraC-like DNA-binding protein
MGQDTLFVTRHLIQDAVQNVFMANETVYVKATGGLWLLDKDEWAEMPQHFQKPYVFYSNGSFYDTDFVPTTHLFDVTPMKALIPQKGQFIATIARLGSRMFVATGGELFEYEIRDHYSRSYHNHSIRDIFVSDSLKVISTYSGIFVSDSVELNHPVYSNGVLSLIDGRYFLAWDGLSEFIPPDSTAVIPDVTGTFPGKAREVVLWRGEKYIQNTRSVSRLTDDYRLQPIHQGLEYLDIEPAGDALLFSTGSGLCLRWNGSAIDTVASLPSRIRDVYIANNTILLASDLGVYEVAKQTPNPQTLLLGLPYAVALQEDDFGNLWVATEGGLYVSTPKFDEPLEVIPNTEFNREAIFLYREVLYVGAVNGLYTLNTYEAEKSFLPPLISSLYVPIYRRASAWIVLFLVGVVASGAWFYWWRRGRTDALVLPETGPRQEWNLAELEEQILSNKILSVNELATHLKTNTVQLNRRFGRLGTTPGKFLKDVKIRNAKSLLESGMELRQIAAQVGYSHRVLKKSLRIESGPTPVKDRHAPGQG